MKKSNKLLAGGFLTALLLITAVHITLYAKYKAGDFTVYRAADHLTSGPVQLFPNILFVSVRNVSDASVEFNDVAGVEKDEEDDVSYVQKGDTLLITGRDSLDQRGVRHRVAFSMPYNATLSAFNSSLSFETGKKTAESNPVVYLQKSKAFFSGRESPLQLGRVKVLASDNSTAEFHGNTQISRLDVQLSGSSLELTEGTFGQLSILTDSLSHISLPAKHLVKATIKTIASE